MGVQYGGINTVESKRSCTFLLSEDSIAIQSVIGSRHVLLTKFNRVNDERQLVRDFRGR